MERVARIALGGGVHVLASSLPQRAAGAAV
jgi:hypothetical protein